MLLDRLKRKAQRLSTSKISFWGKDKDKGKKKEAVREQQIEKIREKQRKAVSVPVVVESKPDIKKKKMRAMSLVLKSPQITEKAVVLQDKNQYIFKVINKATKPEVRKAVEEIYNVDVLKVRMINVPAKKKRLGRTSGWQSGYRKAVVTVKKGQNIEILPR